MRILRPPTISLQPRILRTLLVAGILAVGGLVACAQDPPPTPTVVPTPTPEPIRAYEVVANAAAAMGQVSSFRFRLTHPAGSTELLGGLALERADGAFVTPDQLSVEADAYLGTLFVGVEAIVIGNQHFITNPLSGEWSEVSPEDSPLSFLNPAGLIANILGLVREADYASLPKPGEDLVIEAVISSYALSPLVGDVIEGVDVDLVLTFDPASFLLKSARISGLLQEPDEPDAVRLVELTDFNSEIEIVPPIQ
jgi:hypothetical protein